MQNVALLVLVVSVIIIFFMSFETFIAALPWLILAYFIMGKL